MIEALLTASALIAGSVPEEPKDERVEFPDESAVLVEETKWVDTEDTDEEFLKLV